MAAVVCFWTSLDEIELLLLRDFQGECRLIVCAVKAALLKWLTAICSISTTLLLKTLKLAEGSHTLGLG